MEKVNVSKRWILPLVMIGLVTSLSACVLIPGFSSSSSSSSSFSSSSSSTVSTNTNTAYLFSFKPHFKELISKVYLCGSFNSWSETATPMTYNPNTGAYEVSYQLADGVYQYKFKAIGTKYNYWCADKLNPRSSSDGYGGLNSIFIAPKITSSNFTVDYNIPSNSSVYQVVYWMYDNNDNANQYVDLDFSDLRGSQSIDFASSSEHTYRIDVWLNKTNYFDLIQFNLSGESSDTNLGELPLFYGLQDSLSPTNGQSISTSNQVTFSWEMPTNIENITNVRIFIENTNWNHYTDYFTTNLGTATNLTMDFPLTNGNPNGTNGYHYHLHFYSDQGIHAMTPYNYFVTP